MTNAKASKGGRETDSSGSSTLNVTGATAGLPSSAVGRPNVASFAGASGFDEMASMTFELDRYASATRLVLRDTCSHAARLRKT
jgi:hypothetical protein